MSNVTLRDIQNAIERLEDKIDERLNDHEKRIRDNEGFKWKLYGAIGVVSFIASYIWDRILGK